MLSHIRGSVTDVQKLLSEIDLVDGISSTNRGKVGRIVSIVLLGAQVSSRNDIRSNDRVQEVGIKRANHPR